MRNTDITTVVFFFRNFPSDFSFLFENLRGEGRETE